MNRSWVTPQASGVFLLGVIIMLQSAGSVFAAAYTLDSRVKNRVEFHSKATLESFNGKAKSITCELEIDPGQLSRTHGRVTVDLRSLDTGIELRNKHMRENHLHTDSFPLAVFEVDSVTGAGMVAPGSSDSVMVHGRMTIHGATKPVMAPAKLTADDAQSYRLQSEFPLRITDFGIPRPEFLFLKLAEDVRIVVDLTVVPHSR